MSNQTPTVIADQVVTRGDDVRPAAFGAVAHLDPRLGGIVVAKGSTVDVVPLSSVLKYRLAQAPEEVSQDPLAGGPTAPAATAGKGGKGKLPGVEL